MSYLGTGPIFGDYPVKTFTANGVDTTFALDHSVPSDASIVVTLDGVRQHVGSSSAAGGTTLDFGAGNAPANGTSVEVVHLGMEATLNAPADNSVTSGKIIDSAVTSAKIADGAIVNADVNASAAIDATKIADGSVTSTEFQYINSLSSNAQTQIDAKAAVGTANTWTAGQRGEITSLTSATTITIDMADSNNFSCTLAHNATFANPSNLTAGQSGSIFLTQDGTGSRTASWGTDWDFAGGTAPTLTTTASAVDRVDYVVLDSSNIHAVATLNLS